MNLFLFVFTLSHSSYRRILSPVTRSFWKFLHVKLHAGVGWVTLCQSVVSLCSLLLRPDLQRAFAHKGALSMGRVLACVGPWALAPVWSACMWMCVVLPAPCSSVLGLLTACPVTTAVYFTSVCTNWTLIARFLQLGQIRPQLQLSAVRGEAPESGTRQDIWVLLD